VPPPARLAFLTFTGIAVYGAWLLAFGRSTIEQVIDMVRNRGG
jgi:hypothetical protein